MIPTPIGVVTILLALWLLFRPASEMLVFVLFCSLFAGASALDAVALGHSSIPPNEVALGFLALRLCRRDFRSSPAISQALRLNAWLIVYCFYGAISAFILPRIFAGRVMVMSMQHAKSVTPLIPTSQNITQALYLVGTGFAGVAASAVMSKPNAPALLVKGMVFITWIHILTGAADAVASAAHMNGLFSFFRNGAYAQLDQEISTYHRIAGMTPEPSAYAALGIVFFSFSMELWLRNVRSMTTGITSLAMALMLVASTSSTAYVFLSAYGAVLLFRMLLFPKMLGWKKSGILFGVVGTAALVACCLVLLSPSLSNGMMDVLMTMTLNKGHSDSGLERSMWARQGLDLFVQTRGLGVGIGSFRSSNLFTAILGSLGPACLLILAIYIAQVLQPWRRSSYLSGGNSGDAIGMAAAWVPTLLLVPATFSAPSADPGVLFGIFAGAALFLRRFAGGMHPLHSARMLSADEMAPDSSPSSAPAQ